MSGAPSPVAWEPDDLQPCAVCGVHTVEWDEDFRTFLHEECRDQYLADRAAQQIDSREDAL